jgi:HEAT repeat protein
LLHEALIHDRSPFVRVSAALGLGMLGDPAAGEALASCSAQTHEPALAEAATLSLGLLADARTSSVLATRLFSSDARVRSAADLALRALEHGKRLQFEPPLQLDRNELSSVLLAARETLAAAATNDLTRYARELRTAAGEALRGDDANKLAVLSFLAHAGPTPPAVGANDPRELAVDLRAALLPELFALRALPDRALRVALVQALSNARSHDADALLMDLAQDRDVEVRGPALTALGAQPLSERPGWADRLSRMALTEAAFWLRQRAVLALARLPSAAATRTLARVLSTDAYALVRESAAQSLAGRDASVAGPTLLAALRDPEPRVSAAAARALSSTGGEALRAARSDNELAPALRQLLLR